VHNSPPMPKTLVVLGHVPAEPESFAEIAWGFGWQLAFVSGVDELREHGVCRQVVAVLVNPDEFGRMWPWAASAIREAAPGSQLIACKGFSSDVSGEMEMTGVFHSLHFPFNRDEVRQGLGFVWASLGRKQNSNQIHQLMASAVA